VAFSVTSLVPSPDAAYLFFVGSPVVHPLRRRGPATSLRQLAAIHRVSSSGNPGMRAVQVLWIPKLSLLVCVSPRQLVGFPELRQVVGVSPLLHNGVWEVPHLHLGRCPTSACRSSELLGVLASTRCLAAACLQQRSDNESVAPGAWGGLTSARPSILQAFGISLSFKAFAPTGHGP
jgi:hypothetical protein